MKKSGLQGRIILSAAIPLLSAGILAFLVYSYLQGTALASAGKSPTASLQVAEVNKAIKIRPAYDLSRTSPSWKRKLSKLIFANIQQELQLLGQEMVLHKSAEGKLLIKKVKISFRNMRAGKQRFVRNGVESSLTPFYRGRAWVEYRLWKLKNLTNDLGMAPAKTQSIYRVYALINKWLVYVAHREISARRKGNIAAPQKPDMAKTAEPVVEAENQAPPQNLDVAKVTEQDIEQANIALSQQPDPSKTAEPELATETTEPVVEAKSQVSPQAADMDETFESAEVADPIIESETTEPVAATKSQISPQLAETDETFESMDDPFELIDETSESNIEQEPTDSLPLNPASIEETEPNSITGLETPPSNEAPTANWVFVLAGVGIIIAAFLIFRRAGKRSHPQASGRMESTPHEDSSEPTTAYPESARVNEEIIPTGDTVWGNLAVPIGDAPDPSTTEQIENVEESVTEGSEPIASPSEDAVVEGSALDNESEDSSSDREEPVAEESAWEDEADDAVQKNIVSEDEESSPDHEPEDEAVEVSPTGHETIYYTAFKMEEPVTDDDADEYAALQAEDSMARESALDNESEDASSDPQADDDVDEYAALQAEDSMAGEPALDNESEEASAESEPEESNTEDSIDEEPVTGINEKALVVDGVKENRDALSELLSKLGVEASGTGNVHEGLKHAESHHPEIIFWDADALNKKGRKTLRVFQEKNGKDRYKMVVITDSDFDSQRIDDWKLKFHARLSKPIQKVDVLNCLQDLLNREFDVDIEELREENEDWGTETSSTAEPYLEVEIRNSIASPPVDSFEDSAMEESAWEDEDQESIALEDEESSPDSEAEDEAWATLAAQAEAQAAYDEAEDEAWATLAAQVEESISEPEPADDPMAFPPAESSADDAMDEPTLDSEVPHYTNFPVRCDEAVDEVQEDMASPMEESFTDDETEDEFQESIASEDEESSPDNEAESEHETAESIASHDEDSVTESEMAESGAEESAVDEESTESIIFSVINSSHHREAEESSQDSEDDNEAEWYRASPGEDSDSESETAESGAEEPETSVIAKALVVVKNKKNRRALCELLSNLGVETSQADNVKEGIKHTRECDPDIIFMDTGLMDKNGRRSLRNLQKKEGEDRTRMVALTDSKFDPQAAEKWKLKFHAHISQPCQEEDILNCLRELLEFGEEQPSIDSEAMASTEVDASENQDVSQAHRVEFDGEQPVADSEPMASTQREGSKAPLVEFDSEEPSVDSEVTASTEVDASENQDASPAPVPEGLETGQQDVLLLQTILKVAKGFRDINKRLHKIAEDRYSPAGKFSDKDSKGKEEA